MVRHPHRRCAARMGTNGRLTVGYQDVTMTHAKKPVHRTTRRWVFVVGAALVVVAGFLIWANSPSRVGVDAAYLSRGTSLEGYLTTYSCGGELAVRVRESLEEVRVVVTDQRFRIRFGGGACIDTVSFALTEPLRDRALIDQTTGRRIWAMTP